MTAQSDTDHRKSANEFPVSVDIVPVIEDGRGVSVKGIDSNAKRFKEMEKDLRLFSRAIQVSFDGIVMGKTDGVITYVNDAALDLFGSWDKKDFVGKHVLEFIVQRDRERAFQNSLECLRTGQGYMGQFTVVLKNGSELPVEVTTALIKDENGQPVGFIDIIRNISERKKAEESLKASEEKFRTLFAHMMNGYAYCQMIFDTENEPMDFVYLEINDAFERLTGLKKESILERKVSEAIPGIKEANPELFEIYGRVSLTGKSEHFEVFFKPLNIWLSISVHSPKRGYFAAVFENITEQKLLNKKIEEYSRGLEYTVAQRTRELVQTHEKLVKSERLAAMGELAGMVGHDLRNPLTAIKNAAYVIRKKQSSFIGEKGGEMLTIIDKAVDHANKIVDDLLDYSREIHLELEEFSPKSLVSYLMLTFKVPANIRITERVQPDLLIWGDVNKIQRVFVNIIKNAIDAMPNGGVLEIDGCQDGREAELTFKDTGVGMTDETIAKIFKPLFTTKAQGMGFGLAICKRIVEAHGGRIKVESATNKGTKFTISLPLEQKIES